MGLTFEELTANNACDSKPHMLGKALCCRPGEHQAKGLHCIAFSYLKGCELNLAASSGASPSPLHLPADDILDSSLQARPKEIEMLPPSLVK